MAEIFGAFAGTELMIYEEMGFFERGQAARAMRMGETAINGSLPVNPSGGRLSLGHPPLEGHHASFFQLGGDVRREVTT